jgi:dihydrodipicolinate synthase/N-acetylneuraminate lyase
MSRPGWTRRECLAAFASAAIAPHVRLGATAGAEPAASKPMRGAFMILSTPFTEAGAVDWADLEREARFVDACGAQGLVWPQGSSEVASLTREERLKGMEILAGGSRGRKAALVLGVQGRDVAEMREYALRAEALAPDAMIAMPPSGAKSLDDYRGYFRALGALTRRPVIIQTSGGAKGLTPPVDMMIALAQEYPHLGYAKEESEPLIERMKTLVSHRPPMRSVFGASFGSGWLYEMRLGLDGVITGNAMYADLMARIWELHVRRQSAELRDAFSKFLLMRNLSQQIPGADLYVMKKRGVFKTMMTRRGAAPGSGRARSITISPEEAAEIDDRFDALKPYLSVRSPS